MTLELDCFADTSLPIEVEGINPQALRDLSKGRIADRQIWLGRKKTALGELFRIKGTCQEDLSIHWHGNLKSVHWIGAEMTGGQMEIHGDAGRHVGSRMTGGSIIAHTNVADFAAMEMRGGLLRIKGSSGDLLGGNFPGSKSGMNRGTILLEGSVGKGAGQAMRRGTIVIGGDAGKLLGWHMLGGTIVVFGVCGTEPGADMKRGTIILAGSGPIQPRPAFTQGGNFQSALMPMIDVWLQPHSFDQARRLQDLPFSMYHGDVLNGGRGELFVVNEN